MSSRRPEPIRLVISNSPPGSHAKPINLTQVLKLAGVVLNGSEAKAWISDGIVKVNGAVEIRKRRQMMIGDRIEIDLDNAPPIILIPESPDDELDDLDLDGDGEAD
ncbi:hypothetical protein Isop_0847 [Isosphaera pallida ATCC 43644]|uniref:Uncharacterized protein n=1 Tax=Isosphaera pallida (strain ATCC 43644 / DSM 9630 / IS1B) TaxID=575540 RepID=E8R2F2_ISOPI|nr:RNA-binding S4 domain-containing protein [Isosphaera pallida]ADV61437.1 hypothetical protein Isop_0847 [Isosphaera pallida ATCC 43644]